jgi:hypothetical protein
MEQAARVSGTGSHKSMCYSISLGRVSDSIGGAPYGEDALQSEMV